MEQSKIIHVWYTHEEIPCFMYQPIIVTLKSVLPKLFPLALLNFSSTKNLPWKELESGSTIIWVGGHWECFFEQLHNLKSKNVYTVFYNTEPYFVYNETHEIWTYSKFIFENYVKQFPEQKVLYFPVMCEENVPRIPYKSISSCDETCLIFLGSFHCRQEKHALLLQSDSMKTALKEIYYIWDESSYHELVGRKGHIFLNVTKSLEGNFPVLPTFRVHKLLGRGALIISEYSNVKDDDDVHKDLLFYTDVELIPSVFEMLKMKSPEELQTLSDGIYEKFHTYFCAENIPNLIMKR